MFRETEEDMQDEANECEQRFLKICRLMMYIFSFLITLATGVIVHVCFLALIARFQLVNMFPLLFNGKFIFLRISLGSVTTDNTDRMRNLILTYGFHIYYSVF